jgi:hypothetical protein
LRGKPAGAEELHFFYVVQSRGRHMLPASQPPILNTPASTSFIFCTLLLPCNQTSWLYALPAACAGKQVVCALQTHQPALAEAVGGFSGTEEAEVPMLRFKVRSGT